MKKLILRASIIVFILASVARSALAHEVVLLRSEPMAGAILQASPEEVVTWFNEELVSQRSRLTVFNSAGEAVSFGGVDLSDPDHASMIAVLTSLGDGIYTAYWQAVLLDGDESAGTIIFTVGQPSPGETAFDPMPAPAETKPSIAVFIIPVAALFILVLGIIIWRTQKADLSGV
jgi:copper transport protein